MKKRNVLAATFASAILLSSVSAGTALAASGDSFDTKGTITFTKGTAEVDPVDPTNPDQLNPDLGDNEKTKQTGDLTLDVAPNLPFGEHQIGENTVFSTENEHPYLQVSDRRGASASDGWVVTGKMSKFMNGTTELVGAELNFNAGTAVAANVAASTDGSHGAITGFGQTPSPVGVTSFDSTDAETTFFSATAGQGLGTWLEVYNPSDITLTVPLEAQEEGTYEATLTWTISAGPTGSSSASSTTPGA